MPRAPTAAFEPFDESDDDIAGGMVTDSEPPPATQARLTAFYLGHDRVLGLF